eukprot:SM000093S24457  [mRNA]  locus=s93:402785:404732:- [translate_table: standard]
MFAPALALFAERGFHAVALDLPSFGQSSHTLGGTAAQWQGVCWLFYQRSGLPVRHVQASTRWLSIGAWLMTPLWKLRRAKVHAGDAEPSITELAHTVVEAVDAICASSSFDVVGHQAGASVAMRVALTYPQRVRRLALWGIPILDSPWREQLLQPQLPQPPDTCKDHPAAVSQSLHNRFPGEVRGWPVQARAVVEMLQMREERAWLMKAVAAMDHEVVFCGYATSLQACSQLRRALQTPSSVAQVCTGPGRGGLLDPISAGRCMHASAQRGQNAT